MSKRKHTKEPWQYEKAVDPRGYNFISINTGTLSDYKDTTICGIWGNDPVDFENAKRIVACVNACEGIPTEALSSVNDWSKAGAASAKKFRDQRNSLRHALEQLFSLHEPEGRFQPSHFKPILQLVRETLANTGGDS